MTHARFLALTTAAAAMSSACAPAHYSTRNLAAYEVKGHKLSESFTAEKVSSDDFLALVLQKVCVSQFPDAFGQGSAVIAGAEIEGFEFYNETTDAWEPKTVRHTINAVGVYSDGCINFTQFSLGEYRYKDNPFRIRLTLKKLANEKEKKFAESMLETGKSALGALGPGATAALPIANLLYSAVVDRQLEEAVVLTFTADYSRVSTGGLLPFVPRRGQTVIIGEVAPATWKPWANAAKRPDAAEIAALEVKPDGELKKGTQQYTDAFYLTLAFERLHRNPVILRKSETLIDMLVDGGYSPASTPTEGLARALEYSAFHTSALKRNDFAAEEKLYVSALHDCIAAWASRVWKPGIQVSSLATGDQDARQHARIALIGAANDCGAFYKLTDMYAGAPVSESNIRTLCVEAGRQSAFSPTCSEYRLRLASDRAAAMSRATVQAIAQRDERIGELKAESVVLANELKKQKVEVEAVYADLKSAGLDVKNIKEGLQAYRAASDASAASAARLQLLKKKVAELGLLGPAVVIRKNRITVDVPGAILFDLGSYVVSASGEDVLRKLARIIRETPSLASRTFQVAGHTDNTPVSPGANLLDNWHLSVMRARSVVLLLTKPEAQGGGGLAASQLSAAGYGDLDPLNDNSTEELRSKNRRVELVLIPDAQELIAIKEALDKP